MIVLKAAVLVAWTLIVVRALAFRATISMRTIGRVLALGVLLGVTAVQLSIRLVDPYSASNPLTEWFVALVTTITLVVPIVVVLGRADAKARASVSDHFLLGFVLGLGRDIAGLMFLAANPDATLDGIRWVPPFVATNATAAPVTVAGWAYIVAVIALVVGATARWTRARFAPIIAGAVVGLVGATIQTAVLFPDVDFFETIVAVTARGRIVPWFVLIALIACNVAEQRWAPAAMPRQGSLVKRVARWRAAVRSSLLERSGQVGEVAEPAVGATPREPISLRSVARHGWAPALLVVTLFILPRIGVGDRLWSVLLVGQGRAGPQMSIIAVVLAGIVFWWSVRSRPPAVTHPGSPIEGRLSLALLFASRGALVLSVAFVHLADLYPVDSVFAAITSQQVAALTPAQLTAIVMLLACVTAHLGTEPVEAWRTASAAEQRQAVVRNTLGIVVAVAVMVVAVLVFQWFVVGVHERFGEGLFSAFKTNGNAAAAIFGGALCAVVGFIAYHVTRRAARRVEVFLVGDD